jgi:hypothetical protein
MLMLAQGDKPDAAADGGHHCGLCLHLDQTSAKIMP